MTTTIMNHNKVDQDHMALLSQLYYTQMVPQQGIVLNVKTKLPRHSCTCYVSNYDVCDHLVQVSQNHDAGERRTKEQKMESLVPRKGNSVLIKLIFLR